MLLHNAFLRRPTRNTGRRDQNHGHLSATNQRLHKEGGRENLGQGHQKAAGQGHPQVVGLQEDRESQGQEHLKVIDRLHPRVVDLGLQNGEDQGHQKEEGQGRHNDTR